MTVVIAQGWDALDEPQPLLSALLLSSSVTLSNLFDLLLLPPWGLSHTSCFLPGKLCKTMVWSGEMMLFTSRTHGR